MLRRQSTGPIERLVSDFGLFVGVGVLIASSGIVVGVLVGGPNAYAIVAGGVVFGLGVAAIGLQGRRVTRKAIPEFSRSERTTRPDSAEGD